MSLETGTRIADLVATNPVGATDFVSQGDDHIRLIKACVQGSFPSLGADAVTATALELNKLHGTDAETADFDKLHDVSASAAELNILDGATIDTNELNRLDGVTSGIQTQLDALSGGKQPIDSDLTALAALTTAPYGRDFNTLADNAALATKIAAMVPTWSGAHVYTGSITRVGAGASYDFWEDATPTKAGRVGMATSGLGDYTAGQVAIDGYSAGWYTIARHGPTSSLYGNAAGTTAHEFRGPILAPTCATTATVEYGKLCFTATNVTLPNGDGGQWMLILINGGSPVTFTKPTGSTTYLSNLGVTCSTFTVAPHGMCLVIAGGPTLHFVSGDITGYT